MSEECLCGALNEGFHTPAQALLASRLSPSPFKSPEFPFQGPSLPSSQHPVKG
jgi:hypothetical protein